MRILLIANTAWYLHNFRSRLVERLEAEGHEICLSAPPDKDAGSTFFTSRKYIPLRLSRKGINPFAELLALVRVTQLLRKAQADVVLTWTPKPNLYAALAGRFHRVPVLPNVSGLGAVFIKDGLFSRFVGALYGFAFARSPVVFFQNNEDMNAFTAAGRVEQARAMRLPGSGVDLNRFAALPLPTSRPFVFLYVGRLLADKGLRELVEATRQLRVDGHDFVVRLAGFVDPGNPAGITQQELDGWVSEGLVEFLGTLTDVRPAVEAAHCVVLPSYYREGVPRSLLEAAASGRPVITTDAAGCRDTVIPGSSGFLCEPRNVRSLGDCMRRMLELPTQELATMGAAGRTHVEQRFSEEVVLDAYVRHCRKLSAEPGDA